jgi:tetratricopeptide (TPR) repeat protein
VKGSIRQAALLSLMTLGPLACAEPPPPTEVVEIPQPDLTEMEPQVEKRLREVRQAVVANPGSGAAWGRFGMVCHAHDLWPEATAAYRQAWKLEPENERWPYYLGDVLSIVGTDLEGAEEAFRRAMALYPDYGPAHMRLGQVLVASNQPTAAAVELERALELAAHLQPAQVALAQIRLSEGDLETAEAMLEAVLEVSPKHGQALATLGQVYARQGRRDEARRIAERARSPASYNLYSDPLMAEVVAEGVSAVLIWERAKSFLEVGNHEQAALGLVQVVALQPDNADAHLQLAVAYGGLGRLPLARRHLERTVELDPERVEARIRLASFHSEQGRPAEAVPHLEEARRLAPGRSDVAWLLGRARLSAGDPASALTAFEQAATAGEEAPLWALNEWGSALAQTGRLEVALEKFRLTLAAEPANAQALFYSGLALEGLGRVDEAVASYCRSLQVQSSPPPVQRLQALARTCD